MLMAGYCRQTLSASRVYDISMHLNSDNQHHCNGMR